MEPDQNQPSEYQQQEFQNYDDEKQRHGCVTAWLIMMIIVNSIVALVYLFGGEKLAMQLPGNISTSMFYLLAFISAMNVIFAILLFQWKRWGFYGFIGTAVAGFMINLSMGLSVGSSLTGLVGIAILYGILQIKKGEISAWEQME